MQNREGYEFVAVSDILSCKADGAYTVMMLTDGKSMTLSKALGEVEGMLPPELFERIHHLILVNMHHVSQYRKGASVVMDNGDKLSVSKARKERLLVGLGIK